MNLGEACQTGRQRQGPGRAERGMSEEQQEGRRSRGLAQAQGRLERYPGPTMKVLGDHWEATEIVGQV